MASKVDMVMPFNVSWNTHHIRDCTAHSMNAHFVESSQRMKQRSCGMTSCVDLGKLPPFHCCLGWSLAHSEGGLCGRANTRLLSWAFPTQYRLLASTRCRQQTVLCSLQTKKVAEVAFFRLAVLLIVTVTES